MIADLILEFNKKNNPDFILDSNGEFLVAVDVDASLLPEYQRDVLSSYEQNIFTNLTTRLQDYLDAKYEPYGSSNYLDKKYEIGFIANNPSYRRIFYYVKLGLLFSKDNTLPDSTIQIVRAGMSKLDFEPTESDKDKLIVKSIGAPKLFRDWYMCIGKNTQEGLDNLLQILNKKGTWTKKSDNIFYSADTTYVDQITTISQLEGAIVSFFNSNQVDFDVIEDIIINKESLSTGVSIFFKNYFEQSTSKQYTLFGFPKQLIDKFPNLSPAVDYKPFVISDTITYNNQQDLQTSINTLKSTILSKLQSLSDGSQKIKNYDINEYLKKLDLFLLDVNNKLELNKVEPTASLSFKFFKKECPQFIETPDSDVNAVNQAVRDKCLSEFVDGQTNLVFVYAVSQDKNVINNISPASIDENLAAYLFSNAKNINKVSKDYTASNFFSKLIYKKTKFEKEEGLTIKVFMDAAETSFQQSFVSDLTNLTKFSKIKQNIEKENFSQQSIAKSIKDILSDIQNLKQLYETILYRYNLKDVVDDLLKCFLTKNPNLNEAINSLNLFIDGLIGALNYTDPNYAKFIQCTGIPVPSNFAELTPDNAEIIYSTDEVKKQLNNTLEVATNVDYLSTTLIKCANDFAPPEAKQLVDAYVQSEALRKSLKQQYDQLILEAKLYKSAPGSEDAKNKKPSFLKKAARNAWILLQRQAEKEAEKLVKEAAIEIIRSLLKEANNCKPNTDKNKNNNKPLGKPGDLSINLGVQGDVNDLLDLLSKMFSPDQFCSLFNGAADDEFYTTILNFIKQNFPSLYSTQQPIKVNDIVVSSQSLSSIFAVKQFFIVLSTEFPQTTKGKCDKYFEDLSNNPLPIIDEDKCIDFSKQYEEQKKKELVDKGFTEAQAEKVLENEKKIQSKKYKDLQNLSENGVYNEITKKSEETIYPVAPMIKEKVEKQLNALIRSFGNFIDVYKNELIKLINLNSNLITNDGVFYDFIKNQIFVKGYSVDFKATDGTIQPIFKFENAGFVFQSDDYDLLKNSFFGSVETNLKQFLLSKTTGINSEILKFNDINDVGVVSDPKKYSKLTASLSSSLSLYSQEIAELFKKQIDDFNSSQFNSSKVLIDVKSLLHYEDK